jgi:hypothetical protein
LNLEDPNIFGKIFTSAGNAAHIVTIKAEEGERLLAMHISPGQLLMSKLQK